MDEWLARKEGERRFSENIRALKYMPADEGSFVPYPQWVDPVSGPPWRREASISFTVIRARQSSACVKGTIWFW